MTTVDAGASVDLVLLEDILDGEARCEANKTPHDCSAVASYRVVASCDGRSILWCSGRFFVHISQATMMCARCHVKMSGVCWHVYPI